ncbi:hypothetical protein [Clostridium massiliamazoniense]|uniref:hypothetical protein n=1 Tax=Clostridium massiliamazoniense TaxID=1347366 RepID=UPI0006D7B52F|nr:hypothetical protein [Clostridium massiliamazoniense]
MEFYISNNDVKVINNFIFMSYKNIKDFKYRFDNKKYVLIFLLICISFNGLLFIGYDYRLIFKFYYVYKMLYLSVPIIIVARLYLYRLAKKKFLEYTKEFNKFIGNNYIYKNENNIIIQNANYNVSLNTEHIKYRRTKGNLVIYMDKYREPLFFINLESSNGSIKDYLENHLQNVECI